jgi:glycosyltransferase involved in cell wall biosynthesis
MSKKKIVFCIESPGFGGSEINALKIISLLSEKFEVSLVLNPDTCEQIRNYIEQHSLDYKFLTPENDSRQILHGMKAARKVVKQTPGDLFIIWSHHINSYRWLQFTLAMQRKNYIVVEQLLPTSYVEFDRASKLTRPLKRFITPRAFTNVICAYSQVDGFEKYCGTNRITVIPNSRNIGEIASIVNTIRSGSVTQKDVFTITCVGRLTSQKDQQTLLKAVSLISDRESIRILLVGDGEDKEFLLAFAQSLGLMDVTVTGFVKDVSPFLAVSDIFVLPSVDEGLPGALIEAMAAGVPCIASDIPGNNELVIHEKTGLLFPVKDHVKLSNAITYLIGNPSKRECLKQNAYRHVLDNYDDQVANKKWNEITSKFYRLSEELRPL